MIEGQCPGQKALLFQVSPGMPVSVQGRTDSVRCGFRHSSSPCNITIFRYCDDASGDKVASAEALFQGFDVGDDRGDVVAGEAPLEGRHDIWESLHDLGARVVEGLPDVLLVHVKLPAAVQVDFPAEE